MPSELLTDATKEAYASPPPGIVFLHTIELSHDSWPSGLNRRFVNNNASIVGGGNTYHSLGFDLKLPAVTERAASEILVTLDNTDADMFSHIETFSHSQKPLTIVYKAFRCTNSGTVIEDAYANSVTLTVTSVSATLERLTLKATFPNVSNLNFPNEEYTGEKFIGLLA